MYLLSSSCNFSSSPPQPSPGTTRLRLVVPGLGLGGLEWSLWWPPRTTSAQVHRGQVQVQLGFASLYLDLALVDLSGVGGGLPRATPAEVVQVKSRSNSASPRWTWTLPVRPQPGSVRSSSATVRLTLRLKGWKAGGLQGWKVGWMEGWKAGRLDGWKVRRLEGSQIFVIYPVSRHF